MHSGDFLVAQGSIGYRFLYEDYPGPSAQARLGLQYRHRRRSEQGVGHDPLGLEFANSGSDELLLQVGVGYHPKPNLDISLGLDLPIYENYNGTQLARDSTGLRNLRSLLRIGQYFQG